MCWGCVERRCYCSAISLIATRRFSLIKHLERVIGASFRIRDINRQTLQSYINARSKKKGHNGKNISATTIKKELTTFGSVWRFAVDAAPPLVQARPETPEVRRKTPVPDVV